MLELFNIFPKKPVLEISLNSLAKIGGTIESRQKPQNLKNYNLHETSLPIIYNSSDTWRNHPNHPSNIHIQHPASAKAILRLLRLCDILPSAQDSRVGRLYLGPQVG